MELSQEILNILAQESDFHSGEQLAKRAKVSRNAVWKAVEGLRRNGFLIDAIPHKGYRLSLHNQKLCREQLQAACGADRPICYFESVSSTNTVARQLAEEGAPAGTVVLAATQTGGRGRRGRQFFSPDGGLYLSLILRPDCDPQSTLYVTTAAAVAVCRAIESVIPQKCTIKWVNDVYLGDRKVCGILTEGAFNAEIGTLDYVILGIGINLTRPFAGYPAEIADRAEAIFGDRIPTANEKSTFTAALLGEFDALYATMDQKGFLDEYRSRSYLTGKTVCFEREGESHTATVKGIDECARLVVEEQGKQTVLGAGDVSVKPL